MCAGDEERVECLLSLTEMVDDYFHHDAFLCRASATSVETSKILCALQELAAASPGKTRWSSTPITASRPGEVAVAQKSYNAATATLDPVILQNLATMSRPAFVRESGANHPVVEHYADTVGHASRFCSTDTDLHAASRTHRARGAHDLSAPDSILMPTRDA